MGHQMHFESYSSTGILCGECRDGMGVSALLNNCVICPSAQGLLILALSIYVNWINLILFASHSYCR